MPIFSIYVSMNAAYVRNYWHEKRGLPGRVVLWSVGSDIWRPIPLAVFCNMLDEERVEVVEDEVTSAAVENEGRPNVPRSKEDRDPMLKNCLLISLWCCWLFCCWVEGWLGPPFKSRPPRTLFSSPQMPEFKESPLLLPVPEMKPL